MWPHFMSDRTDAGGEGRGGKNQQHRSALFQVTRPTSRTLGPARQRRERYDTSSHQGAAPLLHRTAAYQNQRCYTLAVAAMS